MSVTLRTWHFASPTRRVHSPATIPLEDTAWLDPDARLLSFDRLVHQAEDAHGPGFTVELHGEQAARVAAQLALRYQRLFARRNAASKDARFDALLAAHLALHDRTKPLVRADHDHAIDVWQWVLRLAPDASEALQVAALFHDIERLASEADVRVEQHAPSYLAFKLRHAETGARVVADVVSALGFAPAVVARAAALVARHEQPEHDPDLGVLNDADALSFFALNSPGFLAYFGPEHTRKKVAYTLARMRSAAAHAALGQVRLEPEIAGMIAELRAHGGAPSPQPT